MMYHGRQLLSEIADIDTIAVDGFWRNSRPVDGSEVVIPRNWYVFEAKEK